MSALNVEQVLTESVEGQPEPVGVSVSEISHNSRLEAYSKPQNDHTFSNMTHQPKTVSEVHQTKESQPTPAADCLPLVSNAPPGQPSDQRSFSAAPNPHESQQDLTHEGIPQPVRPHQSTLSGTEHTPAISVVPSSPLTPGAPPNPMVSSEVHRSLEPSNMSAADRRASRRRSAMDSSANHRLSGSHSPTRALASSVPSSPLPKLSEPLPPAFESPTLAELGLSLSVLTGDLPSHQFTAPTNGTFLSPHYLLLCHSQGLDVLPLVSPPKIQPYAL
ncbi:9565_t:CDS:2, partial [Acaulospora colombiana]